MGLRRNIRQSIKRGTTITAEVIDYHLGLATVRLTKGGGVLSNLSTIGGVVERGDQVVVDYSAGIIPVVSPAFITEPEVPGIELAEVVPPPPEAIIPEEIPLPPDPGPASNMSIDIGWCVSGFQWWIQEPIDWDDPATYDGTMHIGFEEWGYLPHVENDYSPYLYPLIWDTNNACDRSFSGGVKTPVPTIIPQSGTYIIYASFWWWAFWHLYLYYPPSYNNLSPADGYYQLGIFKNDELIASVSTRDVEYYSQNRLGQTLVVVDDFQLNDVLELRAWQSVLYPCYSEISGIGFVGIEDPYYYGKVLDDQMNEVRAVLIPGSQGATA